MYKTDQKIINAGRSAIITSCRQDIPPDTEHSPCEGLMPAILGHV